MSLLMDALKRAEEAKRQTTTRPAPAELSLEPAPASALPELSDHLASVDAELRATADDQRTDSGSGTARGGSRKPPAADTAQQRAEEQAAVRNVFAAKSGEPAAPSATKRIAAIIGLGSLAGLAIGAYFYQQIQQISASGSRLLAANAPRPSAAIGAAPASAPPPAAVTPAPAPTLATATAASPAPPADAAPAVAVAAPGMTAARDESKPPAARRPSPAPTDTPPSRPPIRVSTSTQPGNPALGKAYQALQSGDLELARGGYEQALRVDPHNPDALTGIAAIAGRQGRTDEAASYYARALEADPRNAAAIAGIVALRGPGDAATAETRLRNLLNSLPADAQQTAVVHFALGNLYAGQRRWNEAQSAYFQAHAGDSGNPDYHYNLAVSLDQLQQPALAARFYRSAIDAARTRPAAFDPTRIRDRLAELAR